MTAHPKPSPRRREPVHVYPDGREVCNLKTRAGIGLYAGRTLMMQKRQGGHCALCHWYLGMTFDHEAGRGSAGSHRDDRIEVDGRWINAALCYKCNGEKGSKRYHWVQGKYVPVEGKR